MLNGLALPSRGALVGWLLAVALALLLIGGALGAWAGSSYASAQGDATLERLRSERVGEREQVAKDFATATEKARQELAAEVARGKALAAQLQDERTTFEQVRRTLQRRIHNVTTQYQPAPGADLRPIPPCIITRGWLRDYNAAIGAGLPGADPAAVGGGAGEAAGAGADADTGLLLDSGVTPADILAHITDYGAECRGLAAQTNRLIDRWSRP